MCANDAVCVTCCSEVLSALEMTCIVSSGALNSTHSLTRSVGLIG